MVGFGSADVLQSGMQTVSSGMRRLSDKAGGLLRQVCGRASMQLKLYCFVTCFLGV